METESFGHPWFRAGGPKGKAISVFALEDGHWSVTFKVAKSEVELFLSDPRFVRTPYVGRHGWISLKLDPVQPDWEEVAELLRTSYRNNASKRLAAQLDG